jgi:hypothetical protein
MAQSNILPGIYRGIYCLLSAGSISLMVALALRRFIELPMIAIGRRITRPSQKSQLGHGAEAPYSSGTI